MVNMTRGILDEATGASEAIKGKMYALQKLKESPPPRFKVYRVLIP